MAVDKLVDSTQLDADLTSVANAIRTKGGTSASLAFPSGFVSAIADIPSGGGGSPTGSYTPTANTASFTISVGAAFSHFMIYATSNVYAAGSGVRTISLIAYDSSMTFTWRIGSNSAGTAGSATRPETGFSISGTDFIVNTDQNFLGGYTYNWIAW